MTPLPTYEDMSFLEALVAVMSVGPVVRPLDARPNHQAAATNANGSSWAPGWPSLQPKPYDIEADAAPRYIPASNRKGTKPPQLEVKAKTPSSSKADGTLPQPVSESLNAMADTRSGTRSPQPVSESLNVTADTRSDTRSPQPVSESLNAMEDTRSGTRSPQPPSESTDVTAENGGSNAPQELSWASKAIAHLSRVAESPSSTTRSQPVSESLDARTANSSTTTCPRPFLKPLNMTPQIPNEKALSQPLSEPLEAKVETSGGSNAPPEQLLWASKAIAHLSRVAESPSSTARSQRVSESLDARTATSSTTTRPQPISKALYITTEIPNEKTPFQPLSKPLETKVESSSGPGADMTPSRPLSPKPCLKPLNGGIETGSTATAAMDPAQYPLPPSPLPLSEPTHTERGDPRRPTTSTDPSQYPLPPSPLETTCTVGADLSSMITPTTPALPAPRTSFGELLDLAPLPVTPPKDSTIAEREYPIIKISSSLEDSRIYRARTQRGTLPTNPESSLSEDSVSPASPKSSSHSTSPVATKLSSAPSAPPVIPQENGRTTIQMTNLQEWLPGLWIGLDASRDGFRRKIGRWEPKKEVTTREPTEFTHIIHISLSDSKYRGVETTVLGPVVHTYMPLYVPYKKTKELHTTLTADQLICARDILYLALMEGKLLGADMNPARVLILAPRERPLEPFIIALCYLQVKRKKKIRTMLMELYERKKWAYQVASAISCECVEFLEEVAETENWLEISRV